MRHILFNRGYKDKYTAPLAYLRPLFTLFDLILQIALFFTPYESSIMNWYLRALLKQQMNIRIKQTKNKQL